MAGRTRLSRRQREFTTGNPLQRPQWPPVHLPSKPPSSGGRVGNRGMEKLDDAGSLLNDLEIQYM